MSGHSRRVAALFLHEGTNSISVSVERIADDTRERVQYADL
jgi:hypothetical protein